MTSLRQTYRSIRRDLRSDLRHGYGLSPHWLFDFAALPAVVQRALEVEFKPNPVRHRDTPRYRYEVRSARLRRELQVYGHVDGLPF